MLHNIPLNQVLFLDIETVPTTYKYEELSEREQYLWNGKTHWIQKREEISPERSYEKAGIYAEFAKVICVSCGFFNSEEGHTKFRIKSFYGDDEKDLLKDFIMMIKNSLKRKNTSCVPTMEKNSTFHF